MTGNFEIVFEVEMPGAPERVWEAVIEQPSAWLFPTEGMAGEELVDERPTGTSPASRGPTAGSTSSNR